MAGWAFHLCLVKGAFKRCLALPCCRGGCRLIITLVKGWATRTPTTSARAIWHLSSHKIKFCKADITLILSYYFRSLDSQCKQGKLFMARRQSPLFFAFSLDTMNLHLQVNQRTFFKDILSQVSTSQKEQESEAPTITDSPIIDFTLIKGRKLAVL